MSAPRYAKTDETRMRQVRRDIEWLKRRAAPPGLPGWFSVDPSDIGISDGSLDSETSYIWMMDQQGPGGFSQSSGVYPDTAGPDQPGVFASVFVQMRLVSFGSLFPATFNMDGLYNLGDDSGGGAEGAYQPILTGFAFTTTDTQWDTPIPATMSSWQVFNYPTVMTADGPVGGGDVGGGDIIFCGGGIWPASAPWPSDVGLGDPI